MDKMTLTLNSPITEEQWDAITDVDFEHTNEITFHTKHDKIVKFVKASALQAQDTETRKICNTCKYNPPSKKWPCADCDMRDPADRWEPKDVPDTNVGDMIGRQAAIAVADYTDCTGLAIEDVKKVTDEVVKGLKCLPSAQPEPIRINLNEPIKVKLTDWGKEIYYHQYDRTNRIAGREICKPKFPKEDENGYTEFQLWCFMKLYGEHMRMALPNVIEPLEIVYER